MKRRQLKALIGALADAAGFAFDKCLSPECKNGQVFAPYRTPTDCEGCGGAGFLVVKMDGRTTPLSELTFSVRSLTVFDKMHVTTAGELAALTADEIVAYKNAGRVTVKECREQLARVGLGLKP